MKKLFFNARLVDKNTDSMGSILINDQSIEKIFIQANESESLALLNDESIEIIDVQGKVLMPSFIDMHVHLRNPGQEAKETIQSFLESAVEGGFGTLVAMPNTNPVVTDPLLATSIQDKCNSYEMAELIQSISITKEFDGTDTSHLDNLQGFPLVTEDGRDVASSFVMLEAMKKIAKKDIIMSCHCEDASLTEPAKLLHKMATDKLQDYTPQEWANLSSTEIDIAKIDDTFASANKYLALAEDVATMRNIELAKEAGCHIHIAHASTKNVIETIRRYKAEKGVQLSCEITPHHFALNADDEGFLRYIVNPPIRGTEDREALLVALIDETADVIATDHAPHSQGDKQNGAPGFSGLETSFSVSYTELVSSENISMSRLSALMSANPAELLKRNNEGLLQEGKKANFVIVDTAKEWVVDSTKFKTHGKVCPFEGKKLTGKVEQTWFKGKLVFLGGRN